MKQTSRSFEARLFSPLMRTARSAAVAIPAAVAVAASVAPAAADLYWVQRPASAVSDAPTDSLGVPGGNLVTIPITQDGARFAAFSAETPLRLAGLEALFNAPIPDLASYDVVLVLAAPGGPNAGQPYPAIIATDSERTETIVTTTMSEDGVPSRRAARVPGSLVNNAFGTELPAGSDVIVAAIDLRDVNPLSEDFAVTLSAPGGDPVQLIGMAVMLAMREGTAGVFAMNSATPSSARNPVRGLNIDGGPITVPRPAPSRRIGRAGGGGGGGGGGGRAGGTPIFFPDPLGPRFGPFPLPGPDVPGPDNDPEFDPEFDPDPDPKSDPTPDPGDDEPVIPTPGAAAVIALSVLAATRRRRRSC